MYADLSKDYYVNGGMDFNIIIQSQINFIP